MCHRDAVGLVIDGQTHKLLAELSVYAGPDFGRRAKIGGEDLPMIPLSFEKDGVVLDYFSMVSTGGTPRTVTAQELRLECMFPADEATERQHLTPME